MSGNETFLTPDTALMYQRADGTIERAMNAEEAIKLCPVLGKLAAESPDLANAMLELSAMGSAKLASKTEQENVIEPEQRSETVPKPEPAQEQLVQAPDPRRIEQAAKHEEFLPVEETPVVKAIQAEVAEEPAIIAWEIIDKKLSEPADIEHFDIEEITPVETEEVDPVVVEGNREIVESVPLPLEPIAIDVRGALAVADKVITEVLVAIKPENVSEVLPIEPVETAVSDEEVEPDLPQMVAEDPVEDVFEVHEDLSDESEQPAELPEFHKDISILPDTQEEPELAEESVLFEQLTETFEPETIETYEALVTEAEPEPEQLELIDLETFITAQYEMRDEEQPSATLEVIQEHIQDEQPLEQTFVEHVEFISVVADEIEEVPAGQEELDEVIRKIEAVLDEYEAIKPAKISSTETTWVHITPELTEKLLGLLRELGYENPKEILISFADRYDLVFLMQALQHIYQLNNAEGRREILKAAIAHASDNDPHLRLGKLLVALIHRLSLEPAN